METEKVCVNLPPVELGEMDVLVARGLFTTRTDLIRNGIRRVLDEHRELIASVPRSAPAIVGGPHGTGYLVVDQRALGHYRDRGERIRMSVVGILRLADDITPDLADEVIEEIRIFGALRARTEVRDRLADRVVRTL